MNHYRVHLKSCDKPRFLPLDMDVEDLELWTLHYLIVAFPTEYIECTPLGVFNVLVVDSLANLVEIWRQRRRDNSCGCGWWRGCWSRGWLWRRRCWQLHARIDWFRMEKFIVIALEQHWNFANAADKQSHRLWMSSSTEENVATNFFETRRWSDSRGLCRRRR